MKLGAPSELYRAGEMAQLANNLLREHEDLSSGTRIHSKKVRKTEVVVVVVVVDSSSSDMCF